MHLIFTQTPEIVVPSVLFPCLVELLSTSLSRFDFVFPFFLSSLVLFVFVLSHRLQTPFYSLPYYVYSYPVFFINFSITDSCWVLIVYHGLMCRFFDSFRFLLFVFVYLVLYQRNVFLVCYKVPK